MGLGRGWMDTFASLALIGVVVAGKHRGAHEPDISATAST